MKFYSNKKRLFSIITALLLIVVSWCGVAMANSGLVVRSFQRNGVPMLYLAPQTAEKIPGVLVAHGFAGSKQLMLGYAQVLAHAGYAIMLWDFNGHGANPAPLENFTLQQNLDLATAAILEQPEVDSSRLALLGHSMGSGAVMSAAIRNLDRFAATIAISPTGANLTPIAPRNLQLQAGSWEGGFVNNARRLLSLAGGENKNLAAGRGRELVIIPSVEHITILFSNASHQAARKWLDATFNNNNTSNYVDRRMIWYVLHLIGWLLLFAAVVPIFLFTPQPTTVNSIRSLLGLLLAPVAATSALAVISGVGEIGSLGGLMVGGALGIWFFAGGIIWLIMLWSLPRPTKRSILLGIIVFAVLWLAFGAIAQVTWLQWWLIPARLKLVPLLSLACFPWFLASGIAQQNASAVKRVTWWLLETTILLGGLILTASLLPQLRFIFLILPLFPPIMAILAFTSARIKESWGYAIGSAIFFGWMIAAGFPLAA